MAAKVQLGFTLVELMVVVTIVAILAAVAAPSFIDAIARARLEGAVNELGSDLQYARSESLQRGAEVEVSAVGNTGYSIKLTGAAVPLKSVLLGNHLGLAQTAPLTFDRVRGIPNGGATLTLSSPDTKAQLSVVAGAGGRLALCSPGGSFGGYAAC
jgi:prepilin-type N-terminal cleavage/methylation domain-containing protein